MRATTFTQVILQHFLKDPEMPQTVQEWYQEESDPRQRVIGFAEALAEDVFEAAEGPDDPRDLPEAILQNHVLRLAKKRVDWYRVADTLLRHFGPQQSWRPRMPFLN